MARCNNERHLVCAYASAHLFSVKVATQNGYNATLNEMVIVIRRGDGAIAPLGKLVNDFYVLAIRVCIP